MMYSYRWIVFGELLQLQIIYVLGFHFARGIKYWIGITLVTFCIFDL